MKLFKTLTVALILVLMFSCSQSPKKIDFDAIANDLCKCLQPLADIIDEIDEIDATEKYDSVAMQKLILETERIAARSEQCAQKLNSKWGIIPPEEESKADAAFKKACPKIAEIMEQ